MSLTTYKLQLAAMYALDLSDKPHLDAARDVFLMGCYTAQRYSDYSIISEQKVNKYIKEVAQMASIPPSSIV